MNEYSDIAQIIDSPIEEVTKALSLLSYGELVSFKKMIELQYQELEGTKARLLLLEDVDHEERGKVVANVYKLLQKVEDIAVVTEELKNQRKLGTDY